MNRSKRTWAAATPRAMSPTTSATPAARPMPRIVQGITSARMAATYPPAVGDGAGAVPCGCGGFGCLSLTGRWGP